MKYSTKLLSLWHNLKIIFNNLINELVRKNKSRKYFSYILGVVSFILAIYTYSVITQSNSPVGPDLRSVMNLILIDLICLATLIIIISIEIIKIFNKKKGSSGASQLQKNMIKIFIIIAAIPTIIITVFSTYFFNYGIESWFNEKIKTAFKDSIEIARSYMNDHQNLIKAEAIGVADKINYLLSGVTSHNINIGDYLSEISNERNLIEVVVFEIEPLNILAKSRYSFSFVLDTIPKDAFKMARDNVVIIRKDDKVQALLKLENRKNTYLLLSRLIDPNVVRYVEKTLEVYNDYLNLDSNISKLQIQFIIIYLIVSGLLMLCTLLFAMSFAKKIINPIERLVVAANRVKDGNFLVKVRESQNNDEINILTKTFNLMTEELSVQRNRLIEANLLIDQRRRFNETVINNLTAGVVVVNADGIIQMINPRAYEILMLSEHEIIGKEFSEYFPEIGEILTQNDLDKQKIFSKELSIKRSGKLLVIFLKIITHVIDNHNYGYVITFDDITDLVLAQRAVAWSEVARRVAHEIKNPLTPISLAAQRLEKKYKDEIKDQDTFLKYTKTIVKYVGQIGSIVEEFIYFGRLRTPNMNYNDITKIVQDLIFSRKVLENNIEYELKVDSEGVLLYCDADLISQALLNLIKNAEESIEEVIKSTKDPKIVILLKVVDNNFIISIKDNGQGFVPELMTKLTEPYMTSKPRGTGLGLAIVKKIVDDHKGKIEFSSSEDKGATVSIYFTEYRNSIAKGM